MKWYTHFNVSKQEKSSERAKSNVLEVLTCNIIDEVALTSELLATSLVVFVNEIHLAVTIIEHSVLSTLSNSK